MLLLRSIVFGLGRIAFDLLFHGLLLLNNEILAGIVVFYFIALNYFIQ